VPLNAGELSARWWRWNLETPNGINATLDFTGVNCGKEQEFPPLFFLAGAPVDTPVTRSCTIPAGKILFFPLVTVECSNLEDPPFFGSKESELRNCVKPWLNNVTLSLKINGVSVASSANLAKYRAASPLYAFTLPQDNQFGKPGGTSGISVSDGFWVAVKLDKGNHVLQFKARINSGPAAGFEQDITYFRTQK
jgi:hypothetical protein